MRRIVAPHTAQERRRGNQDLAVAVKKLASHQWKLTNNSMGCRVKKLASAQTRSRQETQALMEERDALERGKIEAEREAASYKAQVCQNSPTSPIKESKLSARPPATRLRYA